MTAPFVNPLEGVWLLPALRLPVLLFLAFATLVVHVCQRLVERTTIMIEPRERRSAFARTGLCVGSLVWTLDVAGMFLFQGLQTQNAHLAPVLLSLLMMIASARWTIPPLSNTLSNGRILLAAIGLALGMLASHLLMMTSLGTWFRQVRWEALGMAMLIATFIAAWMATRHRSAQLRAVKSAFRTVPWRMKIAMGLLILPLHVSLVNAFPIQVAPDREAGSGLSVLIVLVLSGVTFSMDQMFKLREEEKRQHVTNHALAMIRKVNPDADDPSGYLLALVVERLETLLSPAVVQIYFQPICPVQPGRGVRFEALLRVQDRDLGRIHPELFFLACERSGKSGWADRLLLVRAIECSEGWTGLGSECAGISVNMAPGTLLEEDFVPWMEQLLARGRWPAGWLQLEITEHALIARAPQLARVLEQLRALGVRVAMDDFGAGFSSLTALADLPIHGIKCDRAFVKGLCADSARQVLLRYICEMGRGLGLSVTVEGIESEAELAMVRDQGAEYIQGYLLARPMPPAQVPAWLEARHQPQLPVDLEPEPA